jgi:hypothetical protein
MKGWTMFNRPRGLPLAAMAALASLALAGAAQAQDKTLVSEKTPAPPAIDGKMDEAWSKAKPLSVALNKVPYEPKDYKGIKKTTVQIRSLYDAENVYLLVQWDDPTQSLEREPWVKQGDGSWKQKKTQDDTGHNNTAYEDKLAMFWDINTSGFADKGCAVACHKARAGKLGKFEDKSPGRKYTNKAGETIDMWHWKGVRNGAVGQVDDQYVDDTKDPGQNADWGRKGDAATGGGYKNNVSDDKKRPAFMAKNPADGKYWVLDADKVPFADTFKAGDMVGGVVVAPFTGSRGDIAAQAVWANGKWTLEIKRKLVTSGDKAKQQDVQFSDLKKKYPFGVAVFDNSQINHLYHEGAFNLAFK